MTTFYTIHCYDQDRSSGEDLIENYKLYTTFEKAEVALQWYIRTFIDEYNTKISPMEEKEVFEIPNITMRDDEKYCHYYETYDNYLFTICKMTVDE